MSNYNLKISDRHNILKSLPFNDGVEAVIYAPTSEGFKKHEIKYVRFVDGVLELKGESLQYDEWFKSQMNLSSASRITSRHNLYTIEDIYEDTIMFAKKLVEESLIELADNLELKILRDEKVTHEEILNISSNLVEFTRDKNIEINGLQQDCNNLNSELEEVHSQIGNVISCINNEKNDKIDYEYLNKVINSLQNIRDDNFKYKEKLV